MNIKFSGLTGLLVYFGLGFLTHIIFVSTTIDWSSAFSLFVILLWWVYLIYKLFIVLAIIAVVAFICYIITIVVQSMLDKRRTHVKLKRKLQRKI